MAELSSCYDNESAVNGNRMDNCGGGGQRLPPDGDEFPTAYQEFANNLRGRSSGSSSVISQQQQYQQYVESRAAGGMTINTTTTSATTNGSSTDHLIGESCVDGFIKSSGSVGTLGGLLASLDNSNKKDKSNASTTLLELEPDRRTSVSNYVLYSTHLQKMEKKLDIGGGKNFYSKESSCSSGSSEDDPLEESTTPPPLPLSMPPSGNGNGMKNKKEQQQQKTANNDLWRQDNMSEKSVKDKIAMFSSQASLDAPLFPCSSVKPTTTTSTARKLVKHKSSEDVFGEEKRHSELLVPKLSSSSSSTSPASNSPPTSYNSYTTSGSGSSSIGIIGNGYTNGGGSASSSSSSSFSNDNNAMTATAVTSNNKYVFSNGHAKSGGISGSCFSVNDTSAKVGNNLTRATSFSGSATSLFSSSDRLQTSSEVLNGVGSGSSSSSSIANGFVSRTNSLVSTLRRPSGGEESAKRSSLDQLIEQRRKGYSKLRGLVIPEKDAVPVDQPIIDLPEIKSRDSILMNQVPRSNIQDKWGSQSSLASNASTVSSSLRPANNGLNNNNNNNNNNSLNSSFKIPAPKILSSYSPAFKRKSLNIYSGTNQNSSSVLSPKSANLNNGNNNIINNCNNNNNQQQQLGSPASDAPMSLESICSPTRSDYSFNFVNSSSTSPENNYSSNNSNTSSGNNNNNNNNNKSKYLLNGNGQRGGNGKGGRHEYDDSDNDSAVSSSQSSISRGSSPLPTDNNGQQQQQQQQHRAYDSLQQQYNNQKTTQSHHHLQPRAPQHSTLKRTSSQETTANGNASTLTAGSQQLQAVAGADTLSRRVLKPQSVEAINRKNILASARCRSGRDHNGSPLIQRKFSDDDDEEQQQQQVNATGVGAATANNGASANNGSAGNNKKQENGGSSSRFVRMNGNGEATNKPQIKVAYIEIVENAVSETEKKEVIEQQQQQQQPRLPPKRNIEPKSVPIPAARPSKPEMPPASSDPVGRWVKLENLPFPWQPGFNREKEVSYDEYKPTPRSLLKAKTSENDSDLLTVLTTQSRSRSAIHVEDTSYGELKNQMSLEDMLALKNSETPKKLPRSNQNGEMKSSLDARRSSSSDSWAEEKMFPSKLGTPSASVRSSRESILDEEGASAKLPAPRNLSRRSASVTDMKKVFEKPEATSPPISGTSSPGGFLNNASSHNRFPSLDSSSVEDNMRPVGSSDTEQDRYSSEQFGSISSLASSTSLISPHELGQLLDEVKLDDPKDDTQVIYLKKEENPSGSVGITLAGGSDCEIKEVTVHRVLKNSIADRNGNIHRGDRVLSINGCSMRGLTHRESQAVLKQPRNEVVLVVLPRAKLDNTGVRPRHRTESVETIVEDYETSGVGDSSPWGPPMTVVVRKDSNGYFGFSIDGGRDSPKGDKPIVIKKIFPGGPAEKTGSLSMGDQLLEVNQRDVSRMSKHDVWTILKKVPEDYVTLLVRHPTNKSL
uniref:PDZ domain-containing protein n=1 Tax=Trichogramma kaykai TaxID=54128 RepID=A0ABD2XD71_9HYME